MNIIADSTDNCWEITREEGYEEVHFEDETFPIHAWVSRNDGEDYWRLEVGLGAIQTAQSTREQHLAAARLLDRAARCVLDLNARAAA